MINYFDSFINTNGVVFPGTLTINATGPATSDGTEMVKLFGDDLWGRFQAIMDYAGLTPNGVTEGPGISQHIEALQKGFVIGPGDVKEYHKNDDPAVLGDRALPLNGQGILRASFPELDLAVYVGDANNAAVAAAGGAYYHADDAAGTIPNIAGIWLILLEARGKFARGLDLAASIDPDGASRFLGDTQLDSFQGHHHNFDRELDGPTSPSGNASIRGTGVISTINVLDPITDGVNGTPRISVETRPVNYSTNKVIVY